MERVVAWPGLDGPGYVNLHWKPPESRGAGFRGRPFKQLQDFMDLAQRASVKPGTYGEIYFCLSTQRITGKLISGTPIAYRHAREATFLKAIWIDVDVKPEKGYATLDEAMSAITAFVAAADLPTPSAIVFSGGGVHVYWISSRPLSPAEWEPYAHGLREQIQKQGLKCDAGLTTDVARVLRVPGTFNNKIPGQPRPVQLKWLGASYDFATDPKLSKIAIVMPAKAPSRVTAAVTGGAPPPFDLTNFPPGGMNPAFLGVLDAVNDAISGITSNADLPLKIDEVVKGCMHFQDSAVTNGKMHPEPLWQLTLLASSFFDEGERWAHYFSKGYPTYDHEETQKKYEQKLMQRAQGNLGWPSCDAFEGAGAKCQTCPFYKKLRSPLNLAERVAPPAYMVQSAPPPPDELALPEGYTTNQNGWICEIVTKTLKDGIQVDDLQPLFMCEIRNPIAQAGRRALLFETGLDGGLWGPATMVEVNLATEQSAVKQLRECGVKPYPRFQKGIVQFMTSWMEKLDAAKKRIQTVPFGWLREGSEGTGREIGFAYGGRVFMADGTEQQAGYTDQKLEQFYQPRGNKQLWYDALKMITDQKRTSLEAIVSMSLAAPLVALIGKNNCVACAWSNESGAHKSTAQSVGLAVWGNPRMTKESPMSSVKGIIHKLGQLKNLPIYWDEISDEEKMDQVRKMLGITTEGRGATNLTQNRTFFETDEWQTLMLVGANKSLVQNIMRNTKDTDAQLQRVFEFYVQPGTDTMRESDVTMLINSLDYNFGMVGLDYAQFIGHNPKLTKDHIVRVLRKFENSVVHQSKERFRAAMAACMYAGAEIANQQLRATFNLPDLWDFLVHEYMCQRTAIDEAEIIGGTTNNTLNAITQFMKAHSRNALWVGGLPAKRPGKPEAIVYIAGPTRDKADPIHVRLAVADRVIEISRERLYTYLKNVDFNATAVMSGLRKHFNATEHSKINLAAGAGVIGGREHVIRIPVPNNSPFMDELYRHATIEERAALGLETSLEVTAAVTMTNGSELERAFEQAKKDHALVDKAI